MGLGEFIGYYFPDPTSASYRQSLMGWAQGKENGRYSLRTQLNAIKRLGQTGYPDALSFLQGIYIPREYEGQTPRTYESYGTDSYVDTYNYFRCFSYPVYNPLREHLEICIDKDMYPDPADWHRVFEETAQTRKGHQVIRRALSQLQQSLEPPKTT